MTKLSNTRISLESKERKGRGDVALWELRVSAITISSYCQDLVKTHPQTTVLGPTVCQNNLVEKETDDILASHKVFGKNCPAMWLEKYFLHPLPGTSGCNHFLKFSGTLWSSPVSRPIKLQWSGEKDRKDQQLWGSLTEWPITELKWQQSLEVEVGWLNLSHKSVMQTNNLVTLKYSWYNSNCFYSKEDITWN